LLCEVAGRMEECVRTSDTVARMGGDEFCVIVREATSPDDLVTVADKIITALSRPFDISGNICRIGASIGFAIYPDDGETVEELLTHSDSAMYDAKNSGKCTCRRWKQ